MTAKQKQALLAYLGYYDGPLDGLWGEKSQQATIDFQRAHMAQEDVDGIFGAATEKRILEVVATGEEPTQQPQTAPETGEAADWWKDIRYFTPEEPNICCPCPRCVGKREYPTEALMKTADSIREELGPMVPSSVRRCQAHNDELSGSAKNSRHIIGKAMDFNCPKSTPAQIEACLTRRKNAGEIRYWYRMSSGWYHFDID